MKRGGLSGALLVIADTHHVTMRTPNRLEYRSRFALLPGLFNPFGVCLFLLDLPCQSGCNGLSRFDMSGTDQLSRKIRIFSPKRIVCSFVQLYAVATVSGKSDLRNGIKAGSILLKRCLEAMRLLWCRIEVDDYRSLHTETISYIPGYCQQKKGEGTFLPVARSQGEECAFKMMAMQGHWSRKVSMRRYIALWATADLRRRPVSGVHIHGGAASLRNSGIAIGYEHMCLVSGQRPGIAIGYEHMCLVSGQRPGIAIEYEHMCLGERTETWHCHRVQACTFGEPGKLGASAPTTP